MNEIRATYDGKEFKGLYSFNRKLNLVTMRHQGKSRKICPFGSRMTLMESLWQKYY